jgi:HTH-type transcriptional regulator / antitoxin HipB
MQSDILPYGKIVNPQQLGTLIRRRRRELKSTQAKAAGLSGVGNRFLSELENGKETIELGKAMKVIQRLGLDIWILPRTTAPDRTEPV